MTRWRIVRTIAAKELREAFRDRKTIFFMVFLPIILYPALLLVISQAAMVQQEKLASRESVVGVHGVAAESPLLLALDSSDEISASVIEGSDFEALVNAGTLDLVMDVEGMQHDGSGEIEGSGTAEARLIYRSTREESWQAVDRVNSVLDDWTVAEIERRLAAAGLPRSTLEPLDAEQIDLANTAQRGGYILGTILPIMVIVTVIMGAYYPAIDLTAGEKERGTIQTLFTAPITPVEVVCGKYLAVVSIALISGLANLASLGLVFGQNLLISPDMAEQLDMTISVEGGIGIAISIVLIALCFGAMLMAVAVLARSFKEAQNFITPVYLLAFIPAVIVQLPGFEFNTTLGILPAVNAVLLMKDVLVHGLRVGPILTTVVSTLLWSTLALIAAARLFSREDVMVGERVSLNFSFRRSTFEERDRPSLGEGFAWYGVGFMLLFYVGAVLQAKFPQPGLLITLWGLLLAPTVLVTWYLRIDLRKTFNLRRPSLRSLAAAVLLAFGAAIVVNLIDAVFAKQLLPASDELQRQMISEMARFFPKPESALDWAWTLFVIALTPAICEEMVFRGFMFSSFRGRMPTWALIALTALLFGVFHLNIYRLFGTTALGVIMGLLVWRSGSIVPAMLYHFINNALAAIGGGLWVEDPLAVDPIPQLLRALPVGLVLLGLGAWLLRGEKPPFVEKE